MFSNTDLSNQQILSKLTPPTPTNDVNPVTQLKLEDIIRKSTLYDINPNVQIKNIIDEYNQGNKTDITVESIWFGKRIGTDEFRLVHRNNVPQLLPYTYYPQRLGIYATGVTEEIRICKQNELCIGAHGRYLINVPQGKLVKAWEGINPIFLGEGPHVIRHQNFRLEAAPLVDLSDNFITHGNYAIVRVPRGKLAKVKTQEVPKLLESSPQPYVFFDPTFKLITKTNNNIVEHFVDASEQLIEHGSIKRIMPKTGEVAIVVDEGKLIAVAKPVLFDSPTVSVSGFLKTNRQTLVFPSEQTQESRRKNNPKDLDGINYEVFRTSDGLPIGVQLLVAYEIENPQLTLEKLDKNDIKPHIENIVVAHMLSVIQSCSSADFQKGGQNAMKEQEKKESPIADIFQLPSEPSPFYSQLSKDTQQLADDLLKIGIRITQLRLEPPKILDTKIADEMAKNSLLNATARAEVSVLNLTSEITSQKAKQASEKQRIEAEREKQNKITQAQWEAEAVTIKAQGELDAATLRAKAVEIEWQAKIRNMQMENQTQLDFMESQAKLFDTHPGLLSLKITGVQADAMRGVQSIVSPEIAAAWYTMPGVGMFAGGARQSLSQRLEQKTGQENTSASQPQLRSVV